MSESNTFKQIQLEFSKLGHRLFRCNTAQGWVGESLRFTKPMRVNVYPGDVIVRNARPLHAGLTDGGSDGIGWTKNGRFLAVETKTEGSRTEPSRLEKQINFIDQVNKSGGIGFFTYSLDEALIKINNLT